jgi:NADH-quinone oxidoreductase subunit J
MYVMLDAHFIGAIQVIVYAGAIMVVFLFVIMLLNLGAPQLLRDREDPKRWLGLLLGFALFAIVAGQIFPSLLSHTNIGAVDGYGSPQAIGRTLFTQYVLPFEAVSILLLIGIVGSILLAKRRI